MRDKGFGDTFERFTRATGIKWLIITITGWFGLNCGCRYRQELLNKWFPYKQKKEMNKKITLEDVLDPISPRVFFTEYWNKKHLIIRRNKFKNLFTWNDFDNYMNQYPDMKGLQIINYRFEILNLKKIIAVAHPENIASCKVLEKLGFKFYKLATYDNSDKIKYNWYKITQ